MTNSDGDLPLFSRSILGGKKSSKLEARVSDELKEIVRRRWTDMHFSGESEYLEYLATVDCFGKGHVRSVQEQRLGMVSTLSDSQPPIGESTQPGAAL